MDDNEWVLLSMVLALDVGVVAYVLSYPLYLYREHRKVGGE